MSKQFFSREPLIWFHYVLLEIIILVFGWISASISYGSMVPFFEMYKWYSIIALYVILSVGDQLIHFILGVD